MLKKWEQLPENMRIDEVKAYYDILAERKTSLFLKRIFDIALSSVLLVVLSPVFLILSILIKIDSPGPVFFRQIRVTQYGKPFRIFKFRTMFHHAESSENLITLKNDSRITKIGKFIRKYRFDEICQLIDIFRGTMTFVGTRPEVPRYVEHYNADMMATLLLPAGLTSLASIRYKDEANFLEGSENSDEAYTAKILPLKMKDNLKAIEQFNFLYDLKIIFLTLYVLTGRPTEPAIAALFEKDEKEAKNEAK